jgi:hypothetical protein
MAYLFIRKTSKESILEYAFQLQIISKDVIPEKIRNMGLIDIDNISISVWNTDRSKVKEQMSLVSVDEFLGTTTKS